MWQNPGGKFHPEAREGKNCKPCFVLTVPVNAVRVFSACAKVPISAQLAHVRPKAACFFWRAERDVI